MNTSFQNVFTLEAGRVQPQRLGWELGNLEGALKRFPPGQLASEVFRHPHLGGDPVGDPELITMMNIPHLAWECFGTLQEELESVAGNTDTWN